MPVSLGIDYATNSVRALLVVVANGREPATCVVDYLSGKQGILLDPRDAHLARQLVAPALIHLFSARFPKAPHEKS
jgi:L-ribulokinase